MSQEPTKARRGRRFPYYDLGVVIDMILKIKDNGVEKLESLTFAKVLGHKSESSSTFKAKISSAKHYGVVVETKDKGRRFYNITDLGKRIVTPISESEKLDSTRLAFFTCELWKEVYDNYLENGKLPNRSTLENILERTYNISPISKSLAYDTFITSGKVAGVFHEEDNDIVYSEKQGKLRVEENTHSQIRLPISTTINITIEVDTKDESSVKNFLVMLEALKNIQK